MLTWDDSYAIALALREQHPQIDLEGVSLEMIYRWTLELSEFDDEPALVNDDILTAIVQEWLEETNPL
jgi:FeS assembly protein IscX